MNTVHPYYLHNLMKYQENELREERKETARKNFKDVLGINFNIQPFGPKNQFVEYGYFDLPSEHRNYWVDEYYNKYKHLIGEKFEREPNTYRFDTDANKSELINIIYHAPMDIASIYRANPELAKNHQVKFYA